MGRGTASASRRVRPSRYAFYIQGVQTITPRIFGAARVARALTPPIIFGALRPTTVFTTAELTVGYRVTRDFTVRGRVLRPATLPATALGQPGGGLDRLGDGGGSEASGETTVLQIAECYEVARRTRAW